MRTLTAKMIIGLIAVILLIFQMPSSSVYASDTGPTMEPFSVGFETTSVNVTITNTTNASAIFPGWVACNLPRTTFSAEIMVKTSTWPAYAVPSSIFIEGRGNVSFMVIMNVPAGVRNGTVGSAYVIISAMANYPGGGLAYQSSAQLKAGVANTDDPNCVGPPHSGQPGVTIVPLDYYPTKKGLSEQVQVYIPYISITALIGLIAGVVIKVKARKKRPVRSP